MLRAAAALLLLALALALPHAAVAHDPTTAVGRAVTALRDGPVSYDPGAAVGAREVDGLLVVLGEDPRVRVAVLPGSALSEISGGSRALAAEIAREAELDGTVLVLAGSRLGAWSSDVPALELDALLDGVEEQHASSELSVRLEAAVRSLLQRHADESNRSTPAWVYPAAALLLAAAIGAAFVAQRGRRREGAAG